MEGKNAIQKIHGVAVQLRGPTARLRHPDELASDLDAAAIVLKEVLEGHERAAKRKKTQIAGHSPQGCAHEWGKGENCVVGVHYTRVQKCGKCGEERVVK